MLLLTRQDIKKVFSMKDAIEANKQAYRLFTQGRAVTPLRTQISSEREAGTFLFMPAYAADYDCASLKIVNVFPKNVDKGLASTQGSIILSDGLTGEITSILDGTYVTQLRTGAATGAAFDLLAPDKVSKGALFGTGGQAAAQLEAMLACRSLEEVHVYSRNAERVRTFVQAMNEEMASYGVPIVAAPSASAAVADADLIAVVTTSSVPVFNGLEVKAGATVSGVGSYQPHMQELDPQLLRRAGKIYFDSRDAVLAEAGDFIIPLQDGGITEAAFTGELGALIMGDIPGRERADEIIVFKSVGIGVQDLVSSKLIYDKAKAACVGTSWGK